MKNKILKVSALSLALLAVPAFYACGKKDENKDTSTMVKTVAEIEAAIESGEKMKLANDIVLTEAISSTKSFVFDGDGYTISFSGISAFAVGNKENPIDVKISNVDFESKSTQNSVKVIHSYDGTKLNVANCNFEDITTYGANAIAAYDTILDAQNNMFKNVSQAIMLSTTINGKYVAKANVAHNVFEKCGYGVFTVSGQNATEVKVDSNKFTNCATFIAQNTGSFNVDKNTFVVGDYTHADKNFKNSRADVVLDINSSNKIEGNATTTNGVEIK